jgi:4-diphosphocytidyl-2-C-methyl-D-erythritol kinase
MTLPRLSAVLVNPGVAVPTRDVFAALAAPALSTSMKSDDRMTIGPDVAGLLSALTERRNDLERPASKLQPIIANVLAALLACRGCQLARMSGSGATCFGLFGSASAAEEAARAMQTDHPSWWIRATTLR